MGEEEKGNVDVIAVIIGNSLLSDNAPIYAAISRAIKESPISVVPVFTSLTTAGDLIARFTDSGSVFFNDEVTLAAAVSRIRFRSGGEPDGTKISGYDPAAVASVLEGKHEVLSQEDVQTLLKAAGFRLLPQLMIKNRADVLSALKDHGFPLAVKVMGPLHKSDVGGVLRLNVPGPVQALAAFDDMMSITGALGILVQPMVAGTEMILGISRENGFGHMGSLIFLQRIPAIFFLPRAMLLPVNACFRWSSHVLQAGESFRFYWARQQSKRTNFSEQIKDSNRAEARSSVLILYLLA